MVENKLENELPGGLHLHCMDGLHFKKHENRLPSRKTRNIWGRFI